VVNVDDAYYPHTVALEVTLACNMRCLHCGSYATGQNRKKALSLAEWKKVIDDLKQLKAQFITLSGGEPFMYKQWRELIKYIRRAPEAKASLISNGYSITEDDIIFMKKQGVSHIGLSLDGDQTVHDYIRQTPGSFQKVLETARLCQKHDFSFSVVTSINQINYTIREELLGIILEHKIKNWQVQVVNSFGRAGKNRESMLISHEQYAQLVHDISRWQNEQKGRVRIMPADSIGYCHPLTDDMLEGAEWQGCNAGKFVIGIESNGNVKGCLSLQHDDFKAGNVRERSLIDIWNDDACFAYTRQYDHTRMCGACSTCSDGKRCQAGCMAIAHSVHGTIYENGYCYKTIMEKMRHKRNAA